MAQHRSLIFALVLAGCGSPSPSPSRCPVTVWYRPAQLDAAHASLAPALIGSWDGWASPGLRSFGTVTADDGTEWREATIHLLPGTYRYAVSVGDLIVKEPIRRR